MPQPRPVIIDMDTSGHFVGKDTPSWPLKLAVGAALVALATGALLFGALLLWLALWLLPVLFIAGAVAWASLRFQLWRLRRNRP